MLLFSHSVISDSAIPWGFPGKTIGEGCHFLITQKTQPPSPALAGRFFTPELPEKPIYVYKDIYMYIYVCVCVSKSFVLSHAIRSQTNREGMEGKKGTGEMSFLLLGDPRWSDWKEVKIHEVRGKRNRTLSVLMIFPLSQEGQS